MKHGLRNLWNQSLDMLFTYPILFMPLATAAFIEILILEILLFVPKKPLVGILGPIIEKFFGIQYLHYPQNVLLIPNLHYYVGIFTYVVISSAAIGATAQVVKLIHRKLPLKVKTVLRFTAANYIRFFVIGILTSALILSVKTLSGTGNAYVAAFSARHFEWGVRRFLPVFYSGAFFVLVLVVRAFLISAIPFIVIREVGLFRALWQSILAGFKNFLWLFMTLAVAQTIYLPIMLIKGFPGAVVRRTFPEALFALSVLGIIVLVFVECFTIVTVTRMHLNNTKDTKK